MEGNDGVREREGGRARQPPDDAQPYALPDPRACHSPSAIPATLVRRCAYAQRASGRRPRGDDVQWRAFYGLRATGRTKRRPV